MKKSTRKFYKYIVSTTILSACPIEEISDLVQGAFISNEPNGGFVINSFTQLDEVLDSKEMADELNFTGDGPIVFDLDDDGNELE